MSAAAHLPLYEEILLLALDDDKGTADGAGFFAKAMGGAILAELVLEGAIRIDQDKKKKVHPVAGARLDDPVLSECLELITDKDKPKQAKEWVMKFANLKDLKGRAARQLVDKGVLREEEGTVLKIFKRTLFPGMQDTASYAFFCPQMTGATPDGVGPDTTELAFGAPAISGNLEVTAELLYQKADAAFMDRLFGAEANLRTPATVISSDTVIIRILADSSEGAEADEDTVSAAGL